MLSNSMARNYAEHSVEGYYKQVSSSYVNPHFANGGVQKVIATFMDGFYLHRMNQLPEETQLVIHDMACGSGEATASLREWQKTRWSAQQSAASLRPVARTSLLASLPAADLQITASDPFTGPAYKARIGTECLPLSFDDIADGQPESPQVFDLVICSFALHLAETTKLWFLLTELSKRARYLVVVAPHKNPHIKAEWGWERIDATMDERIRSKRYDKGDGQEIVIDSVRLRVWKSTMH